MSEVVHLKHWKGFEYSETSCSVNLAKIWYSGRGWEVEQKIKSTSFTRRTDGTTLTMDLSLYRVKGDRVPFYAVVSCVQSEDRSWRFSVLAFKEEDAEYAQRDFKSLLQRTDDWFRESAKTKYILRA
ncbi:MAG: hypothetical protein KGH59_04265 [Candidatus Micrarchaeota archaeon]|nr:hypothetical protein [Candidatus Micrarchaeota archaeon]MDE1804966.1 hypothetical protein [Candidatus Micrarchaeota archaeon]MDE1847178.1 hypothetical protein [Candidatus Micrarchaeota archaeon]